MHSDLPTFSIINQGEVWKRYQTIIEMIQHIEKQNFILESMKSEYSIPDQTRHIVLNSLSEDLKENKKMFFEFLRNFITFSMRGTQNLDIEFSLTLKEGIPFVVDSTVLVLEGRRESIPAEIGQRFGEEILKSTGKNFLSDIIAFYKGEEIKYDTMFGANFERCSLQLLQELYPLQCYYVKIRLPAQSLVDHDITI